VIGFSAYRPITRPDDDNRGGFGAWYTTNLLPRISWGAIGITIIGMLFTILRLNGGQDEMLPLGTTVLSVVCLFMIYFVVTGSKYSADYMGILYRAVPVGLLGLYMLMNTAPN